MILYWYNIKAVWQQTKYGGIAQLGERLNGIQEVSGSIPLISTKNTDFYHKSRCFSNFLRQNDFRISFYLMRYLIDNIYIAIATDF